MAVHPDGTGTGWTNVETVDVDQPHGKDYLYSQHIAKGVRKRINKEHVAFGDSTAGGEHVPGGCNVLDVVDSTADLTDGWNDGTYVGGGLVHETDKGRLWVCSTLDTTYDGATDVTLVKLHPDLQWAGQDVTWAGAHEFDASVDISGNVAMDGDLTVDGKLAVDSSCDVSDVFIEGDVSVAGKMAVDGSCDFSDVYVDGDISVKGSLDVATDLSVSGDVAVDGTTNLTGDVGIAGALAVDGSCDISDLYVDGDMSVKGSLDIATDLSVSGDVAVDGTTNLTGDVAVGGDFSVDGTLVFQDAVLTGDSTFTFDPIAGETGPTFNHFGDWSSRTNNTLYTARTDGEIFAIGAGGANLRIATPSGSIRVNQDQAAGAQSASCKVKAGDTWDVSGATTSLYWLPFGDNT